MTPERVFVDQLFNGTRTFVIPFYQRSYIWDTKEWERFIADMLTVSKSSNRYFLGTIILKRAYGGLSSGEMMTVIDGQQRLTTIALFLKVLYLKTGNNEFFKRKFILPNGHLAIKHSMIDQDDFKKVMLLNDCNKPTGTGNIIKAYNYFLENVNPSDLNDQRVLNDVQLIDIIIDNDDDEQQIFDTINSLGVDLTTAELLKNHLFDETNIADYKQYWQPVFEKDNDCISFWGANLLKGRTQQKNVEAFLNAFLQIKVHASGLTMNSEEKAEYAKASTMFLNYKKFLAKYYSGRELEFIKEMTEYAKIYSDTFNPEIVERTLSSEFGIERITFLIYVADGTTLIPFVLYVIKNVQDVDERKKIFEYLESYFVRRMICRRNTNSYSDLFSENLINANVQTADAFIKYINDKKDTNKLSMPTNADILSAFLNTEHPNYRGLLILYLLESKMRGGKPFSTQLLQYGSYTLEHLMPQKWFNKWKTFPPGVDEQTRIHKVKTLGNFTMITQALNSKIGNNDWKTKLRGKDNQGGLKDFATGLLTLANVLDLKSWDEATIDARAYYLAREAARIWTSRIATDIQIQDEIINHNVELLTDEQTGKQVIIIDDSLYSLDGNTYYYKREFAPFYIGEYVKKRNLKYEEIRGVFSDDLLDNRFKFIGLICPASVYDQWNDPDKSRRYQPEKTRQISSDGIEYYVNTQWTVNSIKKLVEIAQKVGDFILIK